MLGPPGEVVTPGTAMPWASRQVYYPDWMFGEWQVSSVFKTFHIPLGDKWVNCCCCWPACL